MTKLKKEDLLVWLKCRFCNEETPCDGCIRLKQGCREKQAYQQIKEMIQKSGCQHIEQVYKKIGEDGLPAACNEQGNAGIYCKDCGIKLKEA